MARDKVKRNVVGLSGLGLRNCARSRERVNLDGVPDADPTDLTP